MNFLGIYIFNSTRGEWLQATAQHSLGELTRKTAKWGSFNGAAEFIGNEAQELAEEVRNRITEDDEASYTMAALQ